MNVVAQAISDHNWVALGVALAALLIPVILATLGKNLPFVKPLLGFAVGVVGKMKKPAASKGIAALVPVVEEAQPKLPEEEEKMGEVVPLPGRDKK